MVAEWLKNILTPGDYEKLSRRKKDFDFFSDQTGIETYDAPMMLHIAFTIVEPNTIVGVESYRSKLENLCMHHVNNDGNEACKKIERLYKKIMDKWKDCESILRYTIQTLKSGPNDRFNRYIAQFSNDIESQSGLYKEMTYD